ncbi:YggS family pyridoxal phosphate-dependent enzyme [Planktothrix sp. FACHB-1355]|uniref:YggS family pyridoxal phosphate-dependent enzyme n=1 Tax=Planktothrix sp. FACHB-1355 TaxID=2692854 RepID=UPI00168A4B27|nr:YggS family pyridoxal phosphate-dependent enzyme [Planktothrix sp. FACHB-1355]MBD3557339.1 YggS family pyridoxal phosphate-dependent enzyme [Planktothrix sp. FACHB-1355]
MISDNLRRIEDRIARAAERSCRQAADIKLVAVSKFQTPAAIGEAIESGLSDFGENYPQELWAKAAAFPDAGINWHLIGHLQRNKIGKTLPVVNSIQSVDSERLLKTLNQTAQKLKVVIPVLLEVNINAESSKTGFARSDVLPLGELLNHLPNVRVNGLMTIAALNAPPPDCHKTFSALRELRDKLRAAWGAEFPLPELSMGMSGDFEIAISEGATVVRIGSGIFGDRKQKPH